jgi:hypothetical protein
MSAPTDPTNDLPVEPRIAIASITKRLDALESSIVTRAQFDELKQLVQKLALRLDQIAPPDQIPDEHLAIMSAVFAATIGKRFRIRHVQHLGEPSGWTQAGRVNLHAQRNVRRS